MKRVCFYHAGCPDGFGAAWAVWKAWGRSGEYRPRGHDDALQFEDLVGAEVVFADIDEGGSGGKGFGEVLDGHFLARGGGAAHCAYLSFGYLGGYAALQP